MDAARLAEYLERRMRGAKDLRVTNLMRVSGGSAREAWSFDAEWAENGRHEAQALILQCKPSEREYKILAAMHHGGIKVPKPMFLELDPGVLGHPFAIIERAPGRTADGTAMLAEPVPLRRKLADEFVSEMARLHQVDWRAVKLDWLETPHEVVNDLAQPAHAQTQYWHDLYHHERMREAWPIIDAAFAWLRANPVSADRIALVHGDLRAGNFVFDDSGLVAILGSEMAHLGDPLEDLAWSSMLLWGHKSLAGGLIDRDEFIRLYETRSGADVDRKRLFFYQVLGNAKMAVLCLRAIRSFVEGRSIDLSKVLQFNILPVLLGDLAAQLKLV